MPKADETRDEALKRLNERAAVLKARTTVAPSGHAGEAAVGQAWRIIAELLGGVLIGLAIGAIVDWLLPTRPWGMIGGVLGGFALSVFLAKRTADRLMALAKAEQGDKPYPVIVDDEDED